MQERGVHVCNADGLAGFLAYAFRISFAMHITAPDSAAGERDGKAGGSMISTVGGIDLGRAPKFAGADHEGIFQAIARA